MLGKTTKGRYPKLAVFAHIFSKWCKTKTESTLGLFEISYCDYCVWLFFLNNIWCLRQTTSHMILGHRGKEGWSWRIRFARRSFAPWCFLAVAALTGCFLLLLLLMVEALQELVCHKLMDLIRSKVRTSAGKTLEDVGFCASQQESTHVLLSRTGPNGCGWGKRKKKKRTTCV